MVRNVCLLTGRPGVGKTTMIMTLLRELALEAGGFYTEEIRVHGGRQGFRIVTLEGSSTVLASVQSKSLYRVGKYGVEVANLEKVAVPALLQAIENKDLVIIDEIGKMELFSPAFRRAVSEAVESGKLVLGTVMLGPHPWVDVLKAHPRVQVLGLSETNRSEVRECLHRWIGSLLGRHESERL